MENQDMIIAITQQGEQIKELCRRMDSLEKLTETVNRMAISMEKLTASMKTTEENVDKLQTDVALIHDKPAKRWDSMIGALIAALVGAVVGYFIK